MNIRNMIVSDGSCVVLLITVSLQLSGTISHGPWVRLQAAPPLLLACLQTVMAILYLDLT